MEKTYNALSCCSMITQKMGKKLSRLSKQDNFNVANISLLPFTSTLSTHKSTLRYIFHPYVQSPTFVFSKILLKRRVQKHGHACILRQTTRSRRSHFQSILDSEDENITKGWCNYIIFFLSMPLT